MIIDTYFGNDAHRSRDDVKRTTVQTILTRELHT